MVPVPPLIQMIVIYILMHAAHGLLLIANVYTSVALVV